MSYPNQMTSPSGRGSRDSWLEQAGEKLSIAILVVALLYVVFGGVIEAQTDTTQTDRVNPLNSLIWLGLLAAALPVLQQRWREVLALTLGSWALMLLYFYFGFSTLWALDQAASQRRFLLSVVQVILLTIVVSGIRRAPVLHVTIAAFCMAACMADLLDFIVAPGHGMEDDGFTGLHTQKNQTGILLMYGCLATASCLFLVRSRLRRGIFAAVTLIMIGLLIATRSTTSAGVVGCAALGMPVLLAVGRLPRRFRFVIGSTCLLFMAAIAVTYVTWCGVDGSDPLLPLRGATFTDRTDIWSFVAGELAKRPWLGAGYQSFWSIDPALQPSLKTDEWFATAAINQAHNGYLDMLATGGVFGLVGSLLVVGRSIALAWRALSEKLPARLQPDGALAYATAGFHMSFLLGLIVHNFTESNLFNNAALLCVGFLLATLDLEKWRLAVLRTKENQVGDESAKSRFSTADLSLRAGQSRRVKNKPHAC